MAPFGLGWRYLRFWNLGFASGCCSHGACLAVECKIGGRKERFGVGCGVHVVGRTSFEEYSQIVICSGRRLRRDIPSVAVVVNESDAIDQTRPYLVLK